MRLLPSFALVALVLPTLAGCFGAEDLGNKDEDGDGLFDAVEREGWDVIVDSMTERTRRRVTSDASKSDTDGDGIPDQEEFFLATDPRSADTDGDGLTDCQELRHTNRTQCEDDDFFGPFDGGTDTDPKRADSDVGPASTYVSNEAGFTDRTNTLVDGRPETGDGISDSEELAGYRVDLASGVQRDLRTDPRNADSDRDFLDDGWERFVFRSDPTVADTDGDGCLDGRDPVPGQAEQYRPGLSSFTLLRDMDSGGGADVQFLVLYANLQATAPPAGSLRVERGRAQDLSGIDPLPGHSSQCTYSPFSWILIQVIATDDDGLSSENMDIFSMTAAPGASTAGPATVYWNVHKGQLSWNPDGAAAWPAVQGVTFAGADGRLEIRPTAIVPS